MDNWGILEIEKVVILFCLMSWLLEKLVWRSLTSVFKSDNDTCVYMYVCTYLYTYTYICICM